MHGQFSRIVLADNRAGQSYKRLQYNGLASEVQILGFGIDREQRLDDDRIVPSSRLGEQLMSGFRIPHPLPIRPRTGHGIQAVCGTEDPGVHGDGIFRKTSGITLTGPPFTVMPDGRLDVIRPVRLRRNFGRVTRMPPHAQPILVGQGSRPDQDVGIVQEASKVMKLSRDAQDVQILFWKLKPATGSQGHLCHATRMTGEVGILSFQSIDERTQSPHGPVAIMPSQS